ncbi:MAG TPA: hypothetical protein VN750_20965 [Steroidobacteraceae bacterium]|nr:hypothetical protein [Steroidobacteraceae bacterium]
MSAVLAALFPNHQIAVAVRTRLVEDGFPTDRVELASRQDPGPADVVPAKDMADKLRLHFRQLFPADTDAEATDLLCKGVLEGRAVIAVHPRGDIETERAREILEQAGPVELRSRDLENQPMERAASPDKETIIPNVRKILLGPGKP